MRRLLLLLALAATPALAQTKLVYVSNGTGANPIEDLTAFEDWVYFSARGSGQDRELLRTDGVITEEFDLYPGDGPYDGSNPGAFIAFNGWLYFTAVFPQGNGGSWRTDGESIDQFAEQGIESPIIFDDHIYFTSDSRLWRTDGSTVEEVRPTPDEPVGSIRLGTAHNGWLYFTYPYPDEGLWRTDGTHFESVDDLRKSSPEGYVASGDWLYFDATGEDMRTELWRTDGDITEQVTELLDSPSYSPIDPLIAFGGYVYFTFRESSSEPTQLWRTDGSVIEPVEGIEDIQAAEVFDGWLYLNATATDESHNGEELWRTDGSILEEFADLLPGSRGSSPRSFTPAGQWLYFLALSPVSDELTTDSVWRTNGSEVVLISGASGLFADELTVHGDHLYFKGFTNLFESALYRTVIPTVATEPSVPSSTGSLSSAYPNPFQDEASLTLIVSEPQYVKVATFDLLGRQVKVLHEGVLMAEKSHMLTLSGSDLPVGTYVIRAEGESFSMSQRVTRLR